MSFISKLENFRKSDLSANSDTSSHKFYWSIGLAEISPFEMRVHYADVPVFGQNHSFFELKAMDGTILRDSFVCDPFSLVIREKIHIFFEICGYIEDHYVTAIVSSTLNPSTGEVTPIQFLKKADPKVGKKRTWTISYPYPIQIGENYYMTMEEFGQNENTCIYQLNLQRFNLRIIGKLPMRLYDPNIQCVDGQFWVYGIDSDYSIRVFSSDNIRGPYSEHRLSGTYSDKSYSRNGGTVFSFNGKMIRPYQDCSKEYGKSLAFSEISIDADNGLLIKNLDALEGVKLSENSTNPYWATDKVHHFTPYRIDKGTIYALVDGARKLRITNHGWIKS